MNSISTHPAAVVANIITDVTDAATAVADAIAAAVAPASDFQAKGWKGVFNMKLRQSHADPLAIGSLSVINSAGKVALTVPATSGMRGHQTANDFWVVDLGPLPRNPAASGNWIETQEHQTSEIPREFLIGPESVVQPAPPHVVRNEFRVHHEFGTNGSAGCIATINEVDFDHFANLMHELNKHGTTSIPLTLNYTS